MECLLGAGIDSLMGLFRDRLRGVCVPESEADGIVCVSVFLSVCLSVCLSVPLSVVATLCVSVLRCMYAQ